MDDDASLTEIGFLFDAELEKVTQKFTYGSDIVVSLQYVEQEPGAVQSGHYVWPAAPALATYLVQNWKSLPSGNIVELGAGCGLAGLVAAQLDPNSRLIFTDHDPGVLRTIEHTIQLQDRPQAHCSTQSLQWGTSGKAEIQLIETSFKDGNQSTDLIIGSDVIYAKEVVELLFWTVNALLRPTTKDSVAPMFIMCSSFAYGKETEAAIDAECKKHQLDRLIISCELDNKGVRIQAFTRRPLEKIDTNDVV